MILSTFLYAYLSFIYLLLWSSSLYILPISLLSKSFFFFNIFHIFYTFTYVSFPGYVCCKISSPNFLTCLFTLLVLLLDQQFLNFVYTYLSITMCYLLVYYLFLNTMFSAFKKSFPTSKGMKIFSCNLF